jgi:hypothetical protein
MYQILVRDPTYRRGAGRLAAKPGTASYAAMDTNGDGVVSDLDDPYAPYYPGDAHVDWVGMSVRARPQGTAKHVDAQQSILVRARPQVQGMITASCARYIW